jgi:hypothetical protein
MSPSTELLIDLLSVEVPPAALVGAAQSANAISKATRSAGDNAVFDGLLAMAHQDGLPRQASVFGFDSKTAASAAACLNAARVASTEADVVVPSLFASLAVAEMLQLTARQFLEAFAIGAEVSVRLAPALATSSARRFIPASAVGHLGATLSVCRALALDRTTTASALGLSSVQVTGNAVQGTPAYALSVGNAARVGVESAFIAKFGANGPQNAMVAISLMSNAPRLEDLLAGLGDGWTTGRFDGDGKAAVSTLCHDLRALVR